MRAQGTRGSTRSASERALIIEHDVPYEVLHLHHAFGQVMLRHLLERGNARVLVPTAGTFRR